MRAAQWGYYDGLWRCLRPSFNRVALQRTGPSTHCCCTRYKSSNARQVSRPRLLPPLAYRAYSSHAESAANVDDRGTSVAAAQQEAELASVNCLYQTKPPSEEEIKACESEDIVAALVRLRNQQDQKFFGDLDLHKRIIQLVRHMVIVRRHKPTPFMYECVMNAMADPQGSASGVRRLMEDIKSAKLAPTVELCEAALGALANHPDYMLRQEILDMMKEHWLPIRAAADQYVALGMLRDGQYEMALSKLSDMMNSNVFVDAWVLDIFIVVFGDLGFLDEMLMLLPRRTGASVSKEHQANLLYYALDVCSQSFHHQGTVYAWEAAVQTTQLQPADGIVENVLATASRHGDTALATRALDVLARRDKVQTSHYEALCDAFAEAGDFAGMLRIGRIMQQNGIGFSRSGTRMWHMALRRSPAMTSEAERALRSVERDGKTPLLMAGVMLQSIAEPKGSEAVMDLYADMALLCGEACDAVVTQTLMVHSRSPDTRRRLARDYMARVDRDPRRSPRDWHAVIDCLVDVAELDLAFRFAHQALAQTGMGKAKVGWARALVHRAAVCEDRRIWPIIDELSRIGGPPMEKQLHQWLRNAQLASTLGGDSKHAQPGGRRLDDAPLKFRGGAS